MPPYRKVTSKKQSRKLFALARRGKISMAEARGKTRAASGKKAGKPKTAAQARKWNRLPQRVGKKKSRR